MDREIPVAFRDVLFRNFPVHLLKKRRRKKSVNLPSALLPVPYGLFAEIIQ